MTLRPGQDVKLPVIYKCLERQWGRTINTGPQGNIMTNWIKNITKTEIDELIKLAREISIAHCESLILNRKYIKLARENSESNEFDEERHSLEQKLNVLSYEANDREVEATLKFYGVIERFPLATVRQALRVFREAAQHELIRERNPLALEYEKLVKEDKEFFHNCIEDFLWDHKVLREDFYRYINCTGESSPKFTNETFVEFLGDHTQAYEDFFAYFHAQERKFGID